MALSFGSVLKALATASAKELFTMDESNKYAKEQMAYSNQLAQESQKQSPLNQLIGLQRAGLSPALLSGVSAATPSGPSPVGTHSTPSSFSPLEVMGMINQSKLTSAQANLVNQEAISVGRKNKVELDADLSFNSGLRGFLEEQANSDSPNASIYRSVLESNEVFSSGTYTGLENVLNLIGKNDETVVKSLDLSLRKKVLELQNTNEFAKVLASLPRVEQAKAIADISKVYGEIYKLSVDSRVSEETIKKTIAETSKILIDAGADYHKDFVGMINNKDYFSAFMSLGYSTLNAAAAGAGFSLGAKGAGAAGRFASGRMAPTSKKSFDAILKTGFEGKKLKKKDSPLSSLSQSEQNRRILSYY